MTAAFLSPDEPVKVPITRITGWRWVCPSCKTRQTSVGVVAELSQDERQELEEEYGIMYRPGDWESVPESVECKFCGKEWEAE